MIFQIMKNGLSAGQNVILFATMIVTVLFSMSLHEFSHGLISYMQGDPTAKNAGRLTLNPINHINPIGMICMLFCGFGFAKAVPVNPVYYRKPKKGMAITALAGPLINLIVGISVTVIVTVLSVAWNTGAYQGIPILKYLTETSYQTVNLCLYIVLYYNLLLAVFNMLPIPPFDGSRILFAVLPTKYYFKVMKYEILMMLGVFLLLWSGMFTGVFEAIVDKIFIAVSYVVLKVFEIGIELFI